LASTTLPSLTTANANPGTSKAFKTRSTWASRPGGGCAGRTCGRHEARLPSTAHWNRSGSRTCAPLPSGRTIDW